MANAVISLFWESIREFNFKAILDKSSVAYLWWTHTIHSIFARVPRTIHHNALSCVPMANGVISLLWRSIRKAAVVWRT